MTRRGYRWSDLADETRDGILLEMRLRNNPVIRERTRLYWMGIALDRAALRRLPHYAPAEAIRTMRLWTIPGWEQRKTREEMIDAIVMCMRGSNRPLWMIALGLDPFPQE
jgi:hypothetical protein